MASTKETTRKGTKNCKKTSSSKNSARIEQKINQIKQTKEGLNDQFLFNILHPVNGFIGVVAQDQLASLEIPFLPCTFIVNLDNSNQNGTHWLGVSVDTKYLELYDSLGMNKNEWKLKPLILLNFLKKHSLHRKVLSTPILQSNISNMCGFYCIYFILFRKHHTFKQCVSIFSDDLSNNDKILNSALTYICK